MKIILMHNSTPSQMLGMVLVTKNGRIIAIDGGTAGDTEAFKNLVKEHGRGTIDLWLITHPHPDHHEVFVKLSDTRDSEIKVGKILYAPIFEGYQALEPQIWIDSMYDMERAVKESAYDIVNVKKGDSFTVDNVRIEVLRSVNPNLNPSSINDLSVVYMITEKLDSGKEFKFIVLGDLGVIGGNELLELYKDNISALKADAVQMAHHGQNGVDLPVYEAIKPKYAFWSAPDWLWTNTIPGQEAGKGPWKTLEVRSWMETLNTEAITALKEHAVLYTE